MGLDIRAYRGLARAEGTDARHPDGDVREGFVALSPISDFPGRADDIDRGAVYTAKDTMHFRAGSYSGYNRWRDQLAELAGYAAVPHPDPIHGNMPSHAAGVWADPQPGPFVELINFSDCEGVIGADVSAKLAQDFAAFQAKADQHPDEWFRMSFDRWRRAFEMASDHGAVSFG